MRSLCTQVLVCVLIVLLAGTANAVNIETVPVGNPNNIGELSGAGAGGNGANRICGAVDYTYNIGKYEVTAAQYTAFLNAVAATDTYGLYNTEMASSTLGCKIQRSGSPGNYTYSVAAEWADRPVNYVSWGDAARFANWLHNGQPTGDQDLNTTEDGAYFLDGAVAGAALAAVLREPDWRWAISSESEWYKAAYHKNDGATGNYFDYPTSSDSVPSNALDGGGNNATFNDGGYTIGAPYCRTEVGAHVNSPSPYGTFDMGGNVHEWNESVVDSDRGVRGGAFTYTASTLHASSRSDISPVNESYGVGFRVSKASESATLWSSDFDYDGDVDLSDFGVFAACFNGPNRTYGTTGCEDTDLDTDGDADLSDFAVFSACFNGPNRPAACAADPPLNMASIPAGEFAMGCHAEIGESCEAYELPVHNAYVSPFYMDVYDVTNEQYCAYLNSAYARGLIEFNYNYTEVHKPGDSEEYCSTNPSTSRITWNGSALEVVSGREDHPVVYVSWYGAVAYCNWRSGQEGRSPCYNLSDWTCDFSANGYRLPTEAEWEYAARGGEHDPYYIRPWGNTIDGSKANYLHSGDPYEGDDLPTTPVGYYDGNQVPAGVDMANGYGLYDMAGNVYQWCNDWYDSAYYNSSPYADPRGPATGSARVVRGSWWSSRTDQVRTANRIWLSPGSQPYDAGFRMVINAE